MKVAEETPGRLILQDSPWLVWLVGVLFIGGGMFASVSNEKIFGGGFVIAGVTLILAFANTVTAEFNKTTGRFRRSTRGLLTNHEIGHALSEIVKVDVFASPSGDPSRAYRLAVTLASGERVPLTPAYSSGKEDKERMAAIVRRFLNLRNPSEKMPGFGEMVRSLLQ